MNRLTDIDTHLVGHEVDERQVVVAVDTQTHGHREEDGGTGQLQLREGEDAVAAIAPPHHQRQGQQGEVLQEGLPGGELQRLTKAATILHRQERSAQEGDHREDEHRADGKDRDHTDAHLEQEHQTHHQLGTTHPNREGHHILLQRIPAIDREVFAHLEGCTPGVNRLDHTREDEGHGQERTTQVGEILEEALTTKEALVEHATRGV